MKFWLVDGKGQWGNIGTHVYSFASNWAAVPRASSDEPREEHLQKLRYLKLHAVCMIIAWIVLIPNAHFIIRYFRESYPDVTYFDFRFPVLVSCQP